jgi:MFS family permease
MTTARQKSGKIFYGWWVVLAAGVGMALSHGSIVVVTFGIFFKSLSLEFGWSRAQISLAATLSTLATGGAVLVIGRLVDRFGARKVILPSVVLFGLGVIALSSLSAFLWHLYALHLLLGFIGSGTSPLAYSQVISRWFDKQRGLALAVAMAGIPVGAFLVAPATQALITAVGWRQAYVLLGLVAIAGTLPVVGLLLRERPRPLDLAPDSVPGADAARAVQHGREQGLSGGQAWHTASFWWMVGAIFLTSVSFYGCYIHLVPLLTDQGLAA